MPAFPPPAEANDDGDAPDSASSCGGTRHAGAGVAAGDGVDPAADCTMALNSNAASRGAVPNLPRPTEAKDDGGAPGSALLARSHSMVNQARAQVRAQVRAKLLEKMILRRVMLARP